ncbi:replication initiation protein [Enterococcus faecium]|uniref:replication initiation protein n=1 Tax=Enterococcus faecium TaxID=1352 RepID=UPI00345E4EDB
MFFYYSTLFDSRFKTLQQNQKIRFYFSQLKDLSAYKQTAGEVFIKDLARTYDHLMDLRFGRKSNGGLTIERFTMFTDFEIHGEVDNPYVDIKVHEKALPLLNNLESWVRFSLTEFRDLNSSYAKTMFRLLKQYRTQGWAEFSKEDFLELLDIPKSYRQTNINQFVLKPIKEELTPLFKGLTIRKKYGKGRGKPVIGYRFTWKAEINHADDFSKGKQEDLRIKLFNIEHNGELTQKEKWRAKDRILNLPLGTHEADFKKQQQTEKEEAEKQSISNELKQDLLENLQNLFD